MFVKKRLEKIMLFISFCCERTHQETKNILILVVKMRLRETRAKVRELSDSIKHDGTKFRHLSFIILY